MPPQKTIFSVIILLLCHSLLAEEEAIKSG